MKVITASRAHARADELLHRDPAVLREPDAAQPPARRREADLRESGEDAGEALLAGDGLGREVGHRGASSDEMDALVPGADEQVSGLVPGLVLVRDDGARRSRRLGDGVQQHDRSGVDPGRDAALAREHRGDHEAVDLAIEHRVDEPVLLALVPLGLADHEQIAVAVRVFERPLDHVSREL